MPILAAMLLNRLMKKRKGEKIKKTKKGKP